MLLVACVIQEGQGEYEQCGSGRLVVVWVWLVSCVYDPELHGLFVNNSRLVFTIYVLFVPETEWHTMHDVNVPEIV